MFHQHAFVIILWGILMSPLRKSLPFYNECSQFRNIATDLNYLRKKYTVKYNVRSIMSQPTYTNVNHASINNHTTLSGVSSI